MNLGTPITEYDFNDLVNIEIVSLLNSNVYGTMKHLEIITLKQYLYDKAAEDAWKLTNNGCDIEEKTKCLLKSNYHTAKEFISFEQNIIIIGINVEVIDNSSIDYALELLSKIASCDHCNNFDIIEFGKEIKIYGNIN